MCIFNKKRVNSTSEVKNMDKISVVVPCYNEEEALPVYYKEMCRVMDEMKDVVFELIFVDDGSSDATLGIMKDLNEKDSRCRYLSFSRNFGKEAAIYAGLKASEGDYVALMDVDLQDPPTLLPEMYEILQEDGYDNVATKRVTRTGEPHIRSFLSESFYKFVNAISKTEIVDGARDYRQSAQYYRTAAILYGIQPSRRFPLKNGYTRSFPELPAPSSASSAGNLSLHLQSLSLK